MSKLINTDSDYNLWISQLVERYRNCQIRATVKANEELLRFYWSTGEDIVKKKAESRWGESVINSISQDLTSALPGIKGLSPTNLGYAKRFYSLYSQLDTFYPQLVGKTEYEQLKTIIFRIPWGHQRYLIDKFYNNPKRAFYYVRLTLENGWSRAVLLNAIDMDLKEPEGKAVTNFSLTLPEGDLAQEMTKDPYLFDFAALTKPYKEEELKLALMKNIEQFLLELGTGFAFMGREYRLVVGSTEQFIDMLFYNTRLRCYVVIEVKAIKFQPGDVGQLGTYVSAVNHILRPRRTIRQSVYLSAKQRTMYLPNTHWNPVPNQ